MPMVPFVAGGPLHDDTVYIERQADREAAIHVRQMNYLMLIEPSQQGKTSLIWWLQRRFGRQNYVIIHVNMTSLDRTSEGRWYKTFGAQFIEHMSDICASEGLLTPPGSVAELRDFLRALAACARKSERYLVLALDEIGQVPKEFATGFFSILRDVFNSRQSDQVFLHLTFLLAGNFRPQDLVRDETISPFNVAVRVRLADFSYDQVYELVRKTGLEDSQCEALTRRIFYWTEGQPYLVQQICTLLPDSVDLANVEPGVDRIIDLVLREDYNHLPPILRRLSDDPRLRLYVDQVLTGQRKTKFYPALDQVQAQLDMLGVVTSDADGVCIIRNPIYTKALTLMSASDEHVSVNSIEALLQEKLRRLSDLEVVMAGRGRSTPSEVVIEIGRLRRETEDLRQRLAQEDED